MYDGKPGTERVRTRERAMQRLLEMLRDVGALERVAIVHTHAPDRVAELRDQAAHLLPGRYPGGRYYACHRCAHRSGRGGFCGGGRVAGNCLYREEKMDSYQSILHWVWSFSD